MQPGIPGGSGQLIALGRAKAEYKDLNTGKVRRSRGEGSIVKK